MKCEISHKYVQQTKICCKMQILNELLIKICFQISEQIFFDE